MPRYGEEGFDYEAHDALIWWIYVEDRWMVFALFWAQVEIVALLQVISSVTSPAEFEPGELDFESLCRFVGTLPGWKRSIYSQLG